MGQKANILTLKTNKEHLNSCTLNSKHFWESTEFIDTFKRSLDKKGIIVTYSNFNTVAKTSYLTLDLFYRTRKLLKYKKKLKTIRGNQPKKKIINKIFKNKDSQNIDKSATKKIKRIKIKILNKKKQKYNKLRSIFKNLVKTDLVILKLKLLNKKIDKKIAPVLLEYFKSFKKQLFSRRLTLFFDFIKLSTLFIKKEINVNAYTVILGTIFKFLPKQLHNKFFMFLKKLLNKLISIPQTKIKGVKVEMNGKLKGKLRADSFSLSIGKIDSQKVSADMNFSKMHINTLYGCFGLKLWVNYK